MAERVLRSPGVTTREIDLSAPGRISPQGIPAGVIGTSKKGPAFVPTIFANTTEFTNLFGTSDGKYFGVMAVKEWLRNARSGLFLRVLGVGDGKKAASTNVTTNAGFLVGDKIRNQSSTALEQDGAAIGRAINPYAGAGVPDVIAKTTTGTPTVAVTGVTEKGIVITIEDGTDNDPATGHAGSELAAFDGFYILIQNQTNSKSHAFWLSSQSGRTKSGTTILDGTYTVKDLTSIVTDTATLHLVDISGSATANAAAILIAAAINGVTGLTCPAPAANVLAITQDVGGEGAGTFTRITGSTGVTTAEAYTRGDVVATAQVPVSASTAIGVTAVTAVATVNVLTVSATNTIAVGSTVIVTTPGGTATTITYVASGGNATDSIDPAAAGNATAVALSAAINAITGVSAPTPAGLIITATFVAPTAGQVNPTIVIAENTPNAPAGRAYFLGATMATNSESVDYLGETQADVQLSSATNKILRGVLMFASGVLPGLSVNNSGNFTAPSFHAGGAAYDDAYSNDTGSHTGALLSGKFVMYLNGFNHTLSGNPRVITGSMDPLSPIYFSKVFNTDPTKLQEKGHYLHAHYDIPSGIASHTTVAGNNCFLAKGTYNPHAQVSDFSATGYQPSFEVWKQKFSHAFTPWITSQKLGSSRKKLFRFHMLDAGESGHSQVKISITNIQKSTDTSSDYGRFDVQIRSASDLDVAPVILQSFAGINLNPSSDRYIGRIVGDQNTFFEFEKNDGKQKLVTEGLYPNQSQYIRVQVVDQLESGMMEATALPCGFQGKHHLVLDGDALADSIDLNEPPLPFRQGVSVGTGAKKVVDSRFYWGTQYQDIRVASERNKETGVLSLINNLTKWFPSCGAYDAWVGDNTNTPNPSSGAVLDADDYNNNEFSLENIWVQCKSINTSNAVDPTQWHEAVYIRNAEANANGYKPYSATPTEGTTTTDFYQSYEVITGVSKSKKSANGWRYLDVSKDFGQSASKKYLKFTVPMQGGFDGLDIFDQDKSEMNNLASFREMDTNTASDLGGPAGPTTAAFRKALDILAEKSDVDIQLLATPGMRVPGITDYAVDKTEDRFDALYIMDMSAYDHDGFLVTRSSQETSVTNTVQTLANRNLDTSFAATYFPDLVVQDGTTNVVAPPSVAVLGAMSLNDSVAHPWFAPAGFARGALASTIETQVKLSRANMDVLYDGDVNPITSFPETGDSVVVFGQKTMLQAQSALDRVNVRRLLIDVRRKVRTVSNQILFEPNREATLARFSSLVNPILGRIQAQQGVDRYKVIIDTTTTTQQDVENNTIRGKIFLQPTRSIEFISLDFVVTNAGAEI